MSFIGSWDATMKTPIGSLKAVFTFSEEGGVLVGIAEGSGEVIAMTDLHQEGNHISWKQSVRKPLRLNLQFELTRDGDTLAGVSRAGRLPQTAVTAVRLAG